MSLTRNIAKTNISSALSKATNTAHGSVGSNPFAPRFLAAKSVSLFSFQPYRALAMMRETPPITRKIEPSPATQACCKLPENEDRSTFLFYKLKADQVPYGWSNNPANLEKTLSIPMQGLGYRFKPTMPILVLLQDDVIMWYLFEAMGKYHLYNRSSHSAYEITESKKLDEVLEKLDEILENIDESSAEGVQPSIAGGVHGEDLEYGSLMAAS